MQSQPEDTLGDGSGSTAGCDDDRDSPCAGCREVDEIDADAGASKDAQPWRPIEQGCIDDDVTRWVGGVTGSPPVPLLVVVITCLSCIHLVHPSRLLEAVNQALAPAPA